MIGTPPLADWSGTTGGSGYAFDPKPDASWPSVHLAVTVVLAMLAITTSRRWAAAGVVYAVLTGASPVYQGEHHMVDVATGDLTAVIAWGMSGFWLRTPLRGAAARAVPSDASPRRDGGPPRRSGSSADAPHTV